MTNINQVMNDLIRGKKSPQATKPEKISEDQERRILEYIDKGASYTEARDLIMGAKTDADLTSPSTPPGNAGAGTSTQAPKGKISMNEFIRKVTGRWTS